MDDIDLATCLGARFRRMSRIVTRIYNDRLKEFGLQISQVNILFAIYLRPDIQQSMIGEFLVLQRSTLSREIGRLVKEGLVSSNVHRGSRSARLTLTKAGKIRTEKIKLKWKDIQNEMEGYLGKDSLEKFEELESKLLKI